MQNLFKSGLEDDIRGNLDVDGGVVYFLFDEPAKFCEASKAFPFGKHEMQSILGKKCQETDR